MNAERTNGCGCDWREGLKQKYINTYWQTETGSIIITPLLGAILVPPLWNSLVFSLQSQHWQGARWQLRRGHSRYQGSFRVHMAASAESPALPRDVHEGRLGGFH